MSVPNTGWWDCHAHIIGDPSRYPLWAGRNYDPPSATLSDYLALLDRNKIEFGVLVQPSVYGYDNSCLLDALDEARGRLSGIVAPHPDTTAKEFEKWHRQGVRGVRCNLLNPGGLSPESVWRWHDVMRELNWHVELHIAVSELNDVRALIRGFEVPVVVDHIGRIRADQITKASPGFAELVKLVHDGECYVKLSAPYRLTASPAPWDDVSPFAGALVGARPDMCMWATDWPHTQMHELVREADLFAALNNWCSLPEIREVVLSSAARELFHSEG